MTRYDNVKYSLYNAMCLDESLRDSQVCYYGSRVSGTSIGYSDLDFFVEIGKNFHFCKSSLSRIFVQIFKNFRNIKLFILDGKFSGFDDHEAQNVLTKISKAIVRSGEWKIRKLVCVNSSYSVLRVTYTKTNFYCKLSHMDSFNLSILIHLNLIFQVT